MRYIDEMIKDIPIDELLGERETEKSEAERFAVIPDKPTVIRSRPAEVKTNCDDRTKAHPDPEKIQASEERQEKRIKAKRAARIKSGGLGVLAAVLTVVIGAGAVMAYMGLSKNIGPLAQPSSESQTTDTMTSDSNAKWFYVTLNGICSDYISDGRINDIVPGTYCIDLATKANLGTTALPTEILDQVFGNPECPKYGELTFEISAERRMALYVQWKDNDGFTTVYPADSEAPESSTTKQNTDVTVYCKVIKLLFNGNTIISNTSSAAMDRDKFDMLVNSTREEIDPKKLGVPLFGDQYSVTYIDSEKNRYEFLTSDRVGANLIVDRDGTRKYYNVSFNVRNLFASTCNVMPVSDYIITNGKVEKIPYNNEAETDWYRHLTEGNGSPSPLNYGEEKEPEELITVIFYYNGIIHQICNTKYSYANVQVDGIYYHTEDTSILDSLLSFREQIKNQQTITSENDSFLDIYYEDENYTSAVPITFDLGAPLPLTYDEFIKLRKTEVTEDEFKAPKTYGFVYTVTLTDKKNGGSVTVRSSDHPEADVIIDGKYYKCQQAKELIDFVMLKSDSCVKNGNSTRINKYANTKWLERWYVAFLSENSKPVSALGNIAHAYDKRCICFSYNGSPLMIRLTNYDIGNVQINGNYYNVKDFELLEEYFEMAGQ